MKLIAPFLGVPSPERRRATKPVRQQAAKLDESDLLGVCAACFAQPEREFHYVAIDILDARAKKLSEASLPSLRRLAETTSWWDTIDALSTVVGAGVAHFASWRAEMERWAVDPDFWIRRIAILHQLGRRDATDVERLFRIILVNADDREFFIRKAIGWALRDLAWTNPAVVKEFVDLHRSSLSPLSVREAMKNIERGKVRKVG